MFDPTVGVDDRTGLDPYTRPNAASAALILIDVQYDFYAPDSATEIAGTAERIPAMAQLAGAFRALGLPIVHVVRLYRADGADVDAVRRHAVEQAPGPVAPGSPGSRIAPELLCAPVDLDHDALLAGHPQQLGPAEHVLYKPRWGAFYRTALESHLRAHGVDTLVFAGCNFPNCPRTSIYQGSERDFRLLLVPEAMSRLYSRGLDECRGIGVHIAELDALTTWLRANVAAPLGAAT